MGSWMARWQIRALLAGLTLLPLGAFSPSEATDVSVIAIRNTGRLTSEQRQAIARYLQPCWSVLSYSYPIEQPSIGLIITVSPNGETVGVKLAAEDRARLISIQFRVFAERARRAVLDPKCSRLPIPASLLGSSPVPFLVRFRP